LTTKGQNNDKAVSVVKSYHDILDSFLNIVPITCDI